MDNINYNPNLPPNDSLHPFDIEAYAEDRNAQIRALSKKAYEIGGVPEKAAERAANHSSIQRQTAEAKKDRRDATTWWKAKNNDDE